MHVCYLVIGTAGGAARSTVPMPAAGGRRLLRPKGQFMTAAPAGLDPDDVCLHAVRDELAGRGIIVDDPADGVPVSFQGVPGAWCELSLLDTGHLVWTYLSLGRALRPALAGRLARALLGGRVPAPGARPARAGTVSRAFAACGLTVTPGEVDHGDGRLSAMITVTSPAGQARGLLRVTGDRELRWECRLARPGSAGPGLCPAGVARAIAAALADTAGPAR
jgi:hypothetical protein